MRIPVDAIIAREKLTHYLLVPRRKNDKSQFLARAGFTHRNPDRLEAALRQLAVQHDAISDREDEYGVFYQVSGELHGPNGMLSVVTIWMQAAADGSYRFVTLKPAR